MSTSIRTTFRWGRVFRLLPSPPQPASLDRDAIVVLPPPPSPLPTYVTGLQTVTPPPTPQLARVYKLRSQDLVYPYWGYLKPLNVDCPYKNFVLSTDKFAYRIGRSSDMEFRITRVGMMSAHHTTITRNTDDDTVTIVSYAAHHGDPFGTFLNDVKLANGKPTILRHGDRITLGTIPMDSDEDLRFVWLECTKDGWLELYYTQNRFLLDTLNDTAMQIDYSPDTEEL